MNSEELERDSGSLRAPSPPHMRTEKKQRSASSIERESTLAKRNVGAEDGALQCDYDCRQRWSEAACGTYPCHSVALLPLHTFTLCSLSTSLHTGRLTARLFPLPSLSF